MSIIIVHDEPMGEGNLRVEVSTTEAVKLQRELAGDKYEYETDRHALADYLTVHYAWLDLEVKA